MPNYTVRAGRRLVADFRIHESGETVTLDKEQGDRLVADGIVESQAKPQRKAEEPKTEEPKPTRRQRRSGWAVEKDDESGED